VLVSTPSIVPSSVIGSMGSLVSTTVKPSLRLERVLGGGQRCVVDLGLAEKHRDIIRRRHEYVDDVGPLSHPCSLT
jgi:hypothetical protein